MLVLSLRNQTHSFDFKSSFNEVDLEKKDVEDILKQRQEEGEKAYSEKLELSCDSEKKISLDEVLKIKCNLKNSGNKNLKDLDICLEKDCLKLDVLLMQEGEVEFEKTFIEEGEKIVSITAKNEEVSKSSSLTIVVTDKPSVSIKNLAVPENVDYKDKFSINFELGKETLATPKNLKINIYMNSLEREWTIGELTKTTVYDFEFDGSDLKLDENDVKIIVTFEDDKKEEYNLEENFTINLNEPILSEKIIIFFKQITLKMFSFFDNLFS